jgi:hypothetical protein
MSEALWHRVPVGLFLLGLALVLSGFDFGWSLYWIGVGWGTAVVLCPEKETA